MSPSLSTRVRLWSTDSLTYILISSFNGSTFGACQFKHGGRKFLVSLLSVVDHVTAAFNSAEKSAHTWISLDFFLIYTVGTAHLLNSTFDNMPIFTNRSCSLFISSVATNGTFRFFLKNGACIFLQFKFAKTS